MSADKSERLAEEALRLKKAWLILVAILGAGRHLTEMELQIPNYFVIGNNALKRRIADLEHDFEELAKRAFIEWKRVRKVAIAKWLADHFDSWKEAGFGLLNLGRVQEVEKVVGKLGHRRKIDCPPYAQVLVQGFITGSAIRHPEYHLARDLALLYNLLLDAELIMDEALRRGETYCSQPSQSLARMVILTSFNLLESFSSGLATGWLMENPNAPSNIVNALLGRKPNGREMSLSEKFSTYPSIIAGQPKLDGSKPPLSLLFGKCKRRRDSFVHCEPGSTPTRWGYVKETHFHDANLTVARETVDLTCQAICLAWKMVHGTDRPRWLPTPDGGGRFPRIDVALYKSKQEKA